MTLRSPRLAAIRSPWSLVLGLLFFAAFVPARAQEGADGADWTQRYFAGPPDEDLMVSEHGTLRWAGLLGDRRLRHAGAVGCVAVSPDGKWIVSGSWDTTLKVWDTETGREFRSLVGHENWVSAVAVSPDGKWMVSGSWDKTLKVWDAETGRELRSLAGHKEVVLAVAVSPDGKWIVSGNADWTLKLWDAETGRELRSLEGHTDAVWALAVSPDGKWIVSGGLDKTLKVWNAETGALADSIRVDGGPRGVAWHGSSIWVGCANTTICRYEHQP